MTRDSRASQRRFSRESATPCRLVIVGAGGFAREVEWLVRDINAAASGSWEMVGFLGTSDDAIGELLNGIPILNEAGLRTVAASHTVVAIGDGSGRRRGADQAARQGLTPVSLVHPSARVDVATAQIGAGSVICAGACVEPNVTLGDHVVVSVNATIGHNAVLGDFVSIMPLCAVSGWARIESRAYLGAGSVILEHRVVGPGAVVGAGAVVTRDVPPGVTVVGVPARIRGKAVK